MIMSYKKEKKVEFPPDYDILTNSYRTSSSHVKVRHKICNNSFRIRIKHLNDPSFICPYCSGKVNENNKWFRNKINSLYKNSITVLGDYINDETKTLIEYKLCGHQTLVTPKSILSFKNINQFKKCQQCGPIRQSNNENSLGKFVASILPDVDILLNFQGLLKGNKELDIYIPSLKIAIEYDGIYYHSSHFNKDKHSHQSKHEECAELGIRLVEVFSDEYNFCSKSKRITQNLIKRILKAGVIRNVNEEYLNCEKLDPSLGKKFLYEYALKSYDAESFLYFGIYEKDELLMVISFKKSNRKNKIVLSRVASLPDYDVESLFSILWKFSINRIPQNIEEIISFVDRRWGLEEHLKLVGFKFKSYKEPREFLIDRNDRVRRLDKDSIKKNKSKYYKVYDAGHAIWSFKINNNGK